MQASNTRSITSYFSSATSKTQCSSRRLPAADRQEQPPATTSKRQKKTASHPKQTFLDLGQADFVVARCATCGFLYTKGDPSDEKLHQQHHTNYTEGLPCQGWSKERVLYSDAHGRVIALHPADPPQHLDKVNALATLLEGTFGQGADWSLGGSRQALLYVTPGKRVVACLIMETIKKAYLVPGAGTAHDGADMQGSRGSRVKSKQGPPKAMAAADRARGAPSAAVPADAARREATAHHNSTAEPPSALSIATADQHPQQEGAGEGSQRRLAADDASDGAAAGGRQPACSPSSSREPNSPSSSATCKAAVPAGPGDEQRDAAGCCLQRAACTTAGCSPRAEADHRGAGRCWPGQGGAGSLQTQGGQQDAASRRQLLQAAACGDAAASRDGPRSVGPGAVAAAGGRQEERVQHPGTAGGAGGGGLGGSGSGSGRWDGGGGGGGGRDNGEACSGDEGGGQAGAPRGAGSSGDGGGGQAGAPGGAGSSGRQGQAGGGVLVVKRSQAVKAVCGVRMLWVCPKHRRRGIARRLLDVARGSLVLGYVVPLSELAFYHPTTEGLHLLRAYCGTGSVAVYE